MRTTRLTPWVARVLAANAACFAVLSTVLTAPRFVSALAFDPAELMHRPWSIVTHLFVHQSPLHLVVTSIALFIFGPPVERLLGGRRFIAFYLYCGVGAALFSLGLAGVLRVEPYLGASGALFGVVLAFIANRPDAEAPFPSPFPISPRGALATMLVFDALGALVVGTSQASTGIAHLAHVGGAAAAYLFFRVQALAARQPAPRTPGLVRRPVVTPMRVQEAVSELTSTPAVLDHGAPEPLDDADIDRVLDKISQHGIESLTVEERQFLADAAERKRRAQD